MFPQAVCRWTCVLSVGLMLATPVPASHVDEEVALECRFSSGMAAIYIFSRSEARVRRADLLQPREGQVRVTGAEYRFIFRERGSAYRIDLIIDRATGNARRVFGTRENMEHMPERGDSGSGLVYEAGRCRAQHAELR